MPDVTCVHNQVYLLQGAHRLRAQNSMCIRNDSHSHSISFGHTTLRGRPSVLFAVFLRHVLFADLPRMNLGLIRVRRMFHAVQDFGLE